MLRASGRQVGHVTAVLRSGTTEEGARPKPDPLSTAPRGRSVLVLVLVLQELRSTYCEYCDRQFLAVQ